MILLKESLCFFKMSGNCDVLLFFKNVLQFEHYSNLLQNLILKGQGHVTVNNPVISIIYIVAHTWALYSTKILVDRVNPQDF